jgi:hypothetical protein
MRQNALRESCLTSVLRRIHPPENQNVLIPCEIINTGSAKTQRRFPFPGKAPSFSERNLFSSFLSFLWNFTGENIFYWRVPVYRTFGYLSKRRDTRLVVRFKRRTLTTKQISGAFARQ